MNDNLKVINGLEFEILKNIDFKSFYEILSKKFNFFNTRVSKVNFPEVKKILKKHGLEADNKYGEFAAEIKDEKTTSMIFISVKNGLFKFGIQCSTSEVYVSAYNLLAQFKHCYNLETGVLLTYENYDQFEQLLIEHLKFFELFKAEFIRLLESEEY